MVLWLDEMGVGSDAAAGRSWAPVGQTPVIKGTGKRFRVNMISAINPYVIPYALGVRTPGLAGRAHRCWSVPLRGVERPRRKVRFARLIHRRVCAFWRTFGPRRLRRQSERAMVTTQRGAGRVPCCLR